MIQQSKQVPKEGILLGQFSKVRMRSTIALPIKFFGTYQKMITRTMIGYIILSVNQIASPPLTLPHSILMISLLLIPFFFHHLTFPLCLYLYYQSVHTSINFHLLLLHLHMFYPKCQQVFLLLCHHMSSPIIISKLHLPHHFPVPLLQHCHCSLSALPVFQFSIPIHNLSLHLLQIQFYCICLRYYIISPLILWNSLTGSYIITISLYIIIPSSITLFFSGLGFFNQTGCYWPG